MIKSLTIYKLKDRPPKPNEWIGCVSRGSYSDQFLTTKVSRDWEGNGGSICYTEGAEHTEDGKELIKQGFRLIYVADGIGELDEDFLYISLEEFFDAVEKTKQ